MGRKHTQLEVDERINAIVKQITNGRTTTDVLLKFIVDNYDVGDSQAEKDIANARKIIRDSIHEDIQQEVSEAVLRYKEWIGAAIERNDYREARMCQGDLNKLLGLDAPTRTEVSGNVNHVEMKATTLSELRELLNLNSNTP